MVFYRKNVMRLLLFLQRVTFICNLFFLLCLVIRYTHNFFVYDGDIALFQWIVTFLRNVVIILGFFVSVILNWIVNIWEAILLFNRRTVVGSKWFRTFNFVIFLFQIVYYFYA